LRANKCTTYLQVTHIYAQHLHPTPFEIFLPVLYHQNILQKNYPPFLEWPKILKHDAFTVMVVGAGGGWGIDHPHAARKIHRPASSRTSQHHQAYSHKATDPELQGAQIIEKTKLLPQFFPII